MLKRIISLTLALIFALGLLSVNAFADDSATPYADLPIDEFEPDAGITVVASGECGKNGDDVNWVLYNDGTLEISESGKMAFYTATGNQISPWQKNTAIKKVVIRSGITEVSNYAFYGCKELTSVSLPQGLETIGAGFVNACEKIENIEIPDTVTYIGNFAFSHCSSLKSISIPTGVSTIYGSTFDECTNLTEVVITNGTKDIKNGAFYNSTNVTIYSYDGTYAKDFADKNDVAFEYYNLPGDTNLDFSVTDADLPNMLDHIKSTAPLEGAAADNADIYSDKVIDIRDFNYLYNIVSPASDK